MLCNKLGNTHSAFELWQCMHTEKKTQSTIPEDSYSQILEGNPTSIQWSGAPPSYFCWTLSRTTSSQKARQSYGHLAGGPHVRTLLSNSFVLNVSSLLCTGHCSLHSIANTCPNLSGVSGPKHLPKRPPSTLHLENCPYDLTTTSKRVLELAPYHARSWDLYAFLPILKEVCPVLPLNVCLTWLVWFSTLWNSRIPISNLWHRSC